MKPITEYIDSLIADDEDQEEFIEQPAETVVENDNESIPNTEEQTSSNETANADTSSPEATEETTATDNKDITNTSKPSEFELVPYRTPGSKEASSTICLNKTTGDIVDRAGNVIAHAGAERRHWEASQTANAYADTVIRKNQELEAQLANYKALDGLPAQYELSNDDTRNALELAREFKRDPAKTIHTIIAYAKANGIEIEGMQGAIDTKAVESIIKREISALTNQSDPVIEAQQRATEQIQTFFNQNPDGILHQEVLGHMITRDPSLNLETAYLRLKLWVINNGLDWEQDINQQVQARTQQPVSTVPEQQVTKPVPPSQPSMNTRGRTSQNESDLSEFASVDTDYKTIVRNVMAQLNRG